MMKQIRQRFIRIALLALTLAMLLVAGVINAVHLVNTSAELKETLNYIVENDNETPVNTLSGLFEEVKKNGRQGLRIQRYKGLGEMDPHQLWETTMDPERRKMIQVTMEDAIEAERMFTLLMGDDVDPRREYIEKHAAGVKDLDI